MGVPEGQQRGGLQEQRSPSAQERPLQIRQEVDERSPALAPRSAEPLPPAMLSKIEDHTPPAITHKDVLR